MGTYGERLNNSKSYEETVTSIMCQILFGCLLLVPLMIVLAKTKVLNITNDLLFMICFSLIFATLAPYMFYISKMPIKIIKYYIAITMMISVSLFSLIPDSSVRAGYFIGIAVAMVYLDVKMMAVLSVISYLMMNLCLFAIGARWLINANGRFPSLQAAMVLYRSAVLTPTLEFIVLLPVFFIACILARRHVMREEELFIELSAEEERYRLAFEGSDDLIFDYNFDNDRLTYYGSIMEKNADNSVERTMSHAFERLSEGELVHSDDIADVIRLLNGESDEALNVRLCGREPGEYIWIRIEGRVVRRGGKKIRVVGKMSDITEEKQKEKDFLEVAKKDAATGFFTWDIGEQLIERLTGQGEKLYYLFFKIMNLSDISDEYGSFFADAIISRIAETSKAVMKPDDFLFRLNNDTFIAIIRDSDEDMLNMIHSSLEHSLDHIYTGDAGEELDYIVRFTSDRNELLRFVEGEETSVVDPVKKSGDLDYEAVSFTFNILEHSKSFSNSMMLLLEHIANQFNIVNIHIMERDDTPGLEICLYDFSSVPGGSRFNPGERRESDTVELQMTYDILANSEYVIMNSAFLANYSNEARERITNDRTSHFVVPILSGGDVYGTVDYEHLNVDYEWPERTKSTLVEVTRCMSTYLLRDRADSASRAKSDFLASISHEIRTPLNAITGFSELMLSRSNLDPEARKFASGIKGSADNLLAIISGILDFSKIESGKVEILHDHFRLSELIADLYRMTVMSVREKGLDYNISFDGKVPDGLIGDEQRIKQVLLNLVSNAIKFTSDGQIDLTVSFVMDEGRRSGVLMASVSDTGTGIREDEISVIFESFRYADNARNKSTKGVGLGLTICRDLLHLMNGDIAVKSNYGEGSVFDINVPIDVFDERQAEFDEGFAESRTEEVFHLPFICPRAKILIVDDNKVNLDVAKGLIGQYHPQITTAMSGDEALNIYFSEHDFDIIFMDHMMPKMDGIECVNHLRRLNVDGAADVPVVALTANAVKGARKFFLSSGMDDYISKPIKLTTLAEVMARWIPDKYKETPIWDESWEDPSLREEKAEEAPETVKVIKDIYDFSSLEDIRPDDAIRNVGGSKEVYRELLATFYDSDSMSEAQQYYDARDLENYRITVHGLKSSARYIGAEKLSDKAKELEDYSKKNDWESIDREHGSIIPLYRRVADSIKRYLEQGGEAGDNKNKGEVLSKEELVKRLNDLKDSLENMDFDGAADMASALKSTSYEDETVDTDTKDIVRMIENFDFEDAQTNLDILLDQLS